LSPSAQAARLADGHADGEDEMLLTGQVLRLVPFLPAIAAAYLLLHPQSRAWFTSA